MAVLGAHEGTSPVLSALFNGAFEIGTVGPGNNKLTYIMSSPLSADATGDIFIGVTFQAYGADSGTAPVIEGNRVRQCRSAVFHDTYSTKDLIVRNNYFTDVFAGMQQNMNGANTPKLGTALPHVEMIALTNTGQEAKATAGATAARKGRFQSKMAPEPLFHAGFRYYYCSAREGEPINCDF